MPNATRVGGLQSLPVLASLVCAISLGCGQAGPLPSVESDGTSASIAISEGTDPAIIALLDPASRDLLATIDPAETIEATIQSNNVAALKTAARSAGLTATDYSMDSILVQGLVGPVLAFAAAAHPVSITLGDDTQVDRWIPVDRPVVAVPQPGGPYLTEPMEADLSRLAISPDNKRVPMLRSLANAIQTIDGRPYARLTVDGSCSPEESGIVCLITMRGSGIGAGYRADEMAMRSDAPSDWRAAVVDGTRWLQSVPRALIRAAEWTARHDDATAKAITGYRTCCGATWDPAHPGHITLTYTRPCSGSVGPPSRRLASTGDCFDSLRITVDVGVGTVVALMESAGP